jgi:hypothetical protein
MSFFLKKDKESIYFKILGSAKKVIKTQSTADSPFSVN